MIKKLRLLDLFSGAGGAAKGYQMAGFHVTGVDINPMPRYCGDVFIQADALEYVAEHGHEYDAIHASPPCQAYTKSAKQWRKAGKEYPDLISVTRLLLKQTGRATIIENVPGAPLLNPITLNGDFFGINIARIRLFECSFDIPFFLLPTPRRPVKMGRPIRDGDVLQPVGNFSGVDYARQQMNCAWMNQHELSQAIPPAYTQYIGERLLESMEAQF